MVQYEYPFYGKTWNSYTNMDVVLIHPNPGGTGLNDATIEPPLGLGYIAAVLEQQHYTCSIIDANVLQMSVPETIRHIPEHTRIIGIYCNSFSYNTVQSLCTELRSHRPQGLIIIGGPLASAAPEMLLREMDCDAVIRGEGEFSVLKIAENIRQHRPPFEGEISGLMYLNARHEIVASPITRIKNLDELPFPAYHLMPPLNLYKSRCRKKPVAAIVTSRGCPFQCSFCSKDIFGRKITFRSAQNVLAEIDYLVKHFRVRQIDIVDDNFSQNRQRVLEIMDGLIARRYRLAINLQSGIRIETVDEEMLSKMKKAGLYKLAFGVESADEEVLKRHHKQLDLHKLTEVVRMAKKHGIMVYGFFIIGLPDETEEAFNRTLHFAKQLDFDVISFCMAIPFVGTELYDMVQKEGRMLTDTTRNIDSGFYDGKVFFEYKDCDEKMIARRYQRAYKKFYTIQKQIKIIAKIRSWHEIVWLKDAGMFVLQSAFRKFFKFSPLTLPEAKAISDLDAPSTTLLHARIIQKKPFLKRIYHDFYRQFLQLHPLPKILIEVGSGGGCIKDVIPHAITSDILRLPHVDLQCSALSLPVRDKAVDAYVMIDALHHFPRPEAFFREAQRSLKVGGKVIMIEPANTIWSRFIYRHFHHEPFDPNATWTLNSDGPLSSANMALPWILFERDREYFEQQFPALKLVKLHVHTPLRYLLSGGLSKRQLVPSFSYPFIKGLEMLVSPFSRYLGMFITIELEKIKNAHEPGC